jgi:phosphonate transport system ATP-binding protein
MLVIDGVSKTFGQSRALDNACLSVPDGQFVGIIGRSGAGKSTLLRTINRLGEPSAGSITWNGTEVSRLRGAALRDWRRRCAMIFQQFNLVGRLDVLNNVLMGRLASTPAWRSMTKLWHQDDRVMAMAALDQLDMAAYAAQRADRLSGGQQQRVAICRALVQEPEIVLADEPVASLDPRNAKIVMDALRRINRHFGLTVLFNTHSLDLARGYCDRLIGMAAGRIVFDGPPDALTEAAVRDLYGAEANDIAAHPAAPVPAGGIADAATA